ncbi:MAG: hypothetical protein A2987_05970 [Omnitrophica bacterium RIFCSPLOWO2_01_FULL_45_10]|nr:MAG: hypothetical protein A2987_05970 [Omnitrophica bacterium RIFCSPLOWO2_01_FULL_45_10]
MEKFLTAFIDEVKVYVRAGDGGDGCNSIYRDRFNRQGRPDGGDGGRGGDIIFESDVNIQTLLDFQYRQHLKAESGAHGGSNHKNGRRGEDLHIKVPPGTVIKDAKTGLTLRDLTVAGESVVAAKGGEGGRGNSRNRPREKGSPGEEKTLALELKLIADVGIVGFPNAGKSTLISKVSAARPKIANYPFTTKEPMLGVVKVHEGRTFVMADIPGLIEGAHEGRGLGHRFLRHIERTKVLVHLIDIAGVDARDPSSDYVALNNELASYSKELKAKPQITALNKIDLPSAKINLERFKEKFRRLKVYPVSAVTGEGLKELITAIYKKLKS